LDLDFLRNQEHKRPIFKQGIVKRLTAHPDLFSKGDAMESLSEPRVSEENGVFRFEVKGKDKMSNIENLQGVTPRKRIP